MTVTRSTISRGAALGALLWAGALLAFPASGSAQETTDSLRAELTELRAQIDSLKRVVSELQAAGEGGEAEEEAEDELAALRAAAADAAQGGGGEAGSDEEDEEAQDFVGRQRSLQALNPEISVNVDVFGNLNTADAGADNFIPREFEFSFQSSLDPFSRAKIFVSHHVPGPEIIPFAEGEGHGHAHGEEGGGGFAVEEGYLEWVGIPGGLGVKLGRFFQRFGTLNRWHAHALPFQNRTLPHTAFIGEESLSQTGVSFQWMLPVELGGTYETWLEVTRSENANLFGESNRPTVLGHLNGFWQLSESLDLDLGASGIFGEYRTEEDAFDQRVYNVEGALTWRPPRSSRYQELVLRGGWMLLDPDAPAHEEHEEEEQPTGEEEHAHRELADRAQGFWSLAEYRFATSWLLGGRFEWTENPEDPHDTAWLAGPTLTWWQSEWVRLRAEWDYMSRGGQELSQLLLQVTFAMGPHKHETY